jgi:hypothetical protein
MAADATENGPPGVPLSSGFDYVPIEDTPFALTPEQQAEWDEWVAENRRCHLRAMEAASHYVIGRVATSGSKDAERR